MALTGNQLDLERFYCSICLDLLKDPVTTSCGHSYCMDCVKSHWDLQDEKRDYSCPQCRQVFTPRPVLGKNTMLADLVEELKKTGLQASPAAERAKRQRALGGSRLNIQQRIQDREKDVKQLQQEVEAINGSAYKAVQHSEKVFTELIRFMERGHADVMQQVISQQQTELSRVKELQEKLEQEITELKRRDAELQILSHTEDHNQFQHSYPSLSGLSGPADLSSIKTRPLRYFEDVTAAVSEVGDKLLKVLREEWTNISQTVTQVDVLLPEPEPKTRDGFLKYSRDITLDPNTANTLLVLSDGDRKVTFPKYESCSDHPDRFTDNYQVLSKEGLTGRCYWEVEWKGEVGVAVSFKNIRRTGDILRSGFGRNDKSCVLHCDNDSYNVLMNSVETPVPGPWSSRIGVYLDHRAGILSFYSISETMTLLYRVQTTFSQPLHAGLGFQSFTTSEFTAELCKLK